MALLPRVLPLLLVLLLSSRPSVSPERTDPQKGCPFCTPQALRNRSLHQGQPCPLACSLGNQVGLSRSRPWVSNLLIVRQVCTKSLETSHSERLFHRTIAVMAGEGSNLPMVPGCPVEPPQCTHKDKADGLFYFTSN